jgi:hypothetical protein
VLQRWKYTQSECEYAQERKKERERERERQRHLLLGQYGSIRKVDQLSEKVGSLLSRIWCFLSPHNLIHRQTKEKKKITEVKEARSALEKRE